MSEDTFKQMIKGLQKKIDSAEEKTYSKAVIQEYRNPIYFGMLDHHDAVGIIKGPCGDTMKISLQINAGKIQDARFWTDGCGATLACGNMLIKIIRGKTVQDANAITNIQLIDALGGLPKEHSHCALLAVHTLQKTIEQHQKKKHTTAEHQA